ncbi:hypothetical protein BASA81_003831 [Batrachochytrium salamandrivorans]|nr:hypothetical protein BASA81_003831 [Batrachochytrium salamandrivorans]
MVRYGDSVEMDELVQRLKKLRKRFPEEKDQTGSKQEASNFTDLEDTFLRRSENVQTMLKQMGSRKSDTVGITAQIRTKRNIQQELQGMSESLRMMHQLIEKERKKKEKNKTKISEEEMQRRLANIKTFTIVFQKIQAQLVGEREEFGQAANVERSAVTREELFNGLSEFEKKKGNTMSDAALRAGVGFEPSGSSGGGGRGGASGAGEYSQALEEIQKRDEEQDQIIDEIGQLIMEAQQIAEAINMAVEKQNVELSGLETIIDETQGKLDTVNSKMKRTLEARGMSWTRVCMVFICLALVLGVVGVLVTNTTSITG